MCPAPAVELAQVVFKRSSVSLVKQLPVWLGSV